ncbi:hypothetical protein [Pseudohongiella sp.]|uniref:Uncharacterized protein n=1 Tax=marine sediment metagenome TaxID=412755 RepID=A0A0F9WIK4_9ZZZZ|nr:hypothetical protein [Pseudohongiella sp.]HDZ07501.1 hypothetical protein [Pseudohongiella sp.]HEA62994.1 hypothetical protein [Pseudohongiella sp.]
MGGPHIEALQISPAFTSGDWFALDRNRPIDWAQAAKIVKDRLEGRFLRYAGNCLRSPYSGFVVLSIDSLMLETLQQFREGIINGHRQSRRLVTTFLQGRRFQPDFDAEARSSYYKDIRCGLLHQAEARRMWLIRRGESRMLARSPTGEGYVIDVRRFHKAVRQSLLDYMQELVNPEHDNLRTHLWTKMNYISDVRVQRGAEYAVENDE